MVPLLVGTDGSQKMSKSLGNYIGVSETPQQIFGKVMSIADSLLIDYFTLLTDVADKELSEFKQALDNNSVNPMDIKKRLAKEIISQLYNDKEAEEAEKHFAKTVQRKEMPDDIREVCLSFVTLAPDPSKPCDIDVSRLLVEAGLAPSRSEAKRLISQGGTFIADSVVETTICHIESGSIIKAGKRRFAKVINSDII